MKIYSVTFLISAFMLAACSSPQTTNTTTSSVNSTNSANSSSINSSSVNSSPAAAPKVLAKSPTEVMTALNEAAKTNDAATIKGLISKGTLALLEESAKQQGKAVDDLLKQDASMPFEETPEMRNEKITGDTATIEMKNKLSGQYSTVPFVKEDGSWRIALDVYLKEVQEKMREQMNEPANPKGAPGGKTK